MNSLPYSVILRRLATIMAVITLTLTAVAGVTGILLAFYYEPTAGGAYNSLKTITTEIPNGLMIRSLHDIAGNGMIVVGLLELVVMFLGRRFNPSWLTAWVSNIALVTVGMALGWTAMILDWGQVGYWRFRIELGIIETIPVIGAYLREILTGGDAVNTTTVQHLYTLHSYVLSAVAIVLAITHFVSLFYAAKPVQEESEAIAPTLESSGASS